MLKRPLLVDLKLQNHLGNLTQFPCPLHWDRVSYAARIPWVNFFLAHFHFLICVLLLYAVLSSSASTTAMRSYSSSSLSSPWNLSRRSMRQRESLWVFPLVSLKKKSMNKCWSFPKNTFLSFDWQWETVKYFDNKIICDLIEEKHKGIISILVCKVSLKLVFACYFPSSR